MYNDLWMMAAVKPTVKKQIKLKFGQVAAPGDPDQTLATVPAIRQVHRYSSLDSFPNTQSPTRSLGNARTLRSESQSRKEVERDFLLLRKSLEMGEFQRANKKIPFKSRRQLEKEEGSQTPPSPHACQRPRAGRSKSTVRRVPDRFNFSQVKRISIADFRRSKLPGFVSFVCKRKEHPTDIVEKTRSIHCDLFGPDLCPDCQRLENRYDFTQAQKELFPYLSVTSRSLVAAPKLKNQPTPYFAEGRWYISGKKEAGTKALGRVYTQKDLYRRMVLDKDSKKTVNVLFC